MTTLSPAAKSPARMLASSLIAFILLVFAAPPAGAEYRPGGIWIKYQDLPRRVRETVDQERGRREIKQIIEFRMQDRVFFRVLIDERGADRAILVSEGGRVLRETEVPDLPVGRGWSERPIRYEDLPPEIRRTLDRERGRFPVRSIQFVRRDNREFYRCLVDVPGDDMAVRINSIGKVLSIDEVDDWAVGQRETSRYDFGRERVVLMDDVPREVRQVIARESHGRQVKQVVFVERNGRFFYRVIIDERSGDRVLRIGRDGYIYEEREVPDIAVGPGGYNNNRWGHEARMSYDDLPWSVQNTLDRERRGLRVKEIVYVRRFNNSFYRCIIDTPGDDLAVRISDEGTLVSREQVEDTAFGRREQEEVVAPAREEWVKYATLPETARHSLDRQRAGRDVLKIIRVETRGRVFFRCTIDSRPWPTTVYINEDGRVIGM